MKYKIIIACILLMLLFFNIFVSASGINEKTKDDEVPYEIDECTVIITEPECYYIYFQYSKDVEPLKGSQELPLLESLNLILYISLCSQIYVEFYLDCPDSAYVIIRIENIIGTYEEDIQIINPSDGFNHIFLTLPCFFKLYYISADVYDYNDNWLVGDELDCLVAFLPICN